MSLLLFHQGNVPIIEDDMKFAEIKLENNKTTGKKLGIHRVCYTRGCTLPNCNGPHLW